MVGLPGVLPEVGAAAEVHLQAVGVRAVLRVILVDSAAAETLAVEVRVEVGNSTAECGFWIADLLNLCCIN